PGLDERILVTGCVRPVRALADVQAGQGAGPVTDPVGGPAGHRDQAGPEKIPLLTLDAETDDEDDSGDDPDGEDHGCDDDYGAHGGSPLLLTGGFAVPPAPILVFCPAPSLGPEGVLGTA